MINSFTAIDFKTANINAWSICQVGLVRVINGRATEQISILVQPPNNYYREKSIETIGISPEMTSNAPRFNLIWNQLAPFIRNQDVVAHNSFLKFFCLKETLGYYGIAMQEFTGHCTYKIYGDNLASLCKKYNITLKHHDALSNASACAELFNMHLW